MSPTYAGAGSYFLWPVQHQVAFLYTLNGMLTGWLIIKNECNINIYFTI